MCEDVDSREAEHGEKMIELKIRFWTNHLSNTSSTAIVPKHGWTSGVVRIKGNKAHGIVPGKPQIFNSLLDVGTAIERTLKDQGIILHISPGMRKYTDR
jgi:hypothetical protein